MRLPHSIVIVLAETMVKKVFLWLLPLLIVLMGLWVARYLLDTRREVSAETLPSMVAGDPGDYATVSVQTVRLVSATPELKLFGQLQPLQERTLRAPTTGLLDQVSVRPGQRVVAGEVVLTFATEPLERTVRQAELALDQAQRQLERAEQLWARNAITAAERLDAQTQRDSAEVTLASAQSDLIEATVRAPFAGVVQQVMVQAQDRVGVNEPLLHVVSTGDLEVVALLPTRFAAVLEPTMQAHIELGVNDERVLQLERRDPVQAGGSLRLYFSGDLADQVAGSYYSVRLELPPVPDVIPVPLRALYDNQYVYRVTAQDRLERVAVEVMGFQGTGEQQQVLVRSPELAVGDAILTTRLRNATQGLPVLVRESLQ